MYLLHKLYTKLFVKLLITYFINYSGKYYTLIILYYNKIQVCNIDIFDDTYDIVYL